MSGISSAHILAAELVDTPDNLSRLVPVIEGMMDTGLIAASDVEVIRAEKNPPGPA